MARKLKRATYTLSRELGCNGSGRGEAAAEPTPPPSAPGLSATPKPAAYNAASAHERTSRLTRKPRTKRKLAQGTAAWKAVREQFESGLSPE